MNWKVIKTEVAYQKAVKRTIAIFQAKGGTPEADELALLLVLIKDYKDKYIQIPQVNPLEVIKLKMQERGIKAKTWNLLLVVRDMFRPYFLGEGK